MKDQNDFGSSPIDHLAENTLYDEVIIDERGSKEEVEQINPWCKPIHYITWGFLMISFTLNFSLLQYILPTLGVVLMYLGFRNIRNGNRWFFAAWIIAAIKLIWQALQMMLCATPAFLFLQRNNFIGIIMIALQIALLIVFRKALQTVFEHVDIKPTRDPVLLAIIWTGLMALIALFPYVNAWIIVIPLIIFLFFIIRSLYKMGDELEGAANLFVYAPVKLNDMVVTVVYLVCCFILVITGCIYANHIKLNASEQIAVTDNETRTKLVELGFPDNIIKDISNKDISMLREAIHVESSSETLSFHQVEVTTKTGTNSYSTRTEPRGCNLQATAVYLEFSDHQMYVIEHFNWMDSKAYWQDGFTIWSQQGIKLLNGALLYQKNGVDYTAQIPRLKCESETTNSFFGSNESRQISGAVSYPFQSDHQRGYVFYRIQLPKGQLIIGNCLNYIHYIHPIQFPYDETEQRIRSNIFNNKLQQHYTTCELSANEEP